MILPIDTEAKDKLTELVGNCITDSVTPYNCDHNGQTL